MNELINNSLEDNTFPTRVAFELNKKLGKSLIEFFNNMMLSRVRIELELGVEPTYTSLSIYTKSYITILVIVGNDHIIYSV